MAQVCEKEKKETGSKEKPSDVEDKIVGIKKPQTDTKKTTCEGKKPSEGYLVSAEDAPVYNLEVGITSGYRQPLCYAGCLRSVFQIHNETVNIWTHLLGFVFFLWLLFDNCFRYQNHLRDKMDLVATCLQLLSYQVCMVNSAAFHTFLCHSKETKATWHSADHCGILLAFLGTYIRIIIITLRCFPEERLAHLTIVFLLFGTVIAFKYWPGSRGDAKVPLSLFYALALYVIAPFAHWVHLSHGAQQLCYNFDGAVDVVAVPRCVNWTWLLLVPLARETGRWLLDWLCGHLRAQSPVLARVHLLSDGLVALPRFLGISAKSSCVPDARDRCSRLIAHFFSLILLVLTFSLRILKQYSTFLYYHGSLKLIFPCTVKPL